VRTYCGSVLPMATEILTTRAVADHFGVAVSTVTRWVTDGHLTPMQKTPGLRGMYLFTREEVTRYEAERAA
jgi:predicted site-specific integrase-resolvase